VLRLPETQTGSVKRAPAPLSALRRRREVSSRTDYFRQEEERQCGSRDRKEEKEEEQGVINRLSNLLIFSLVASLSLGFAASRPDQTRNSRAILSESPPPFDHKISYGTDALEYGELRLPHDSSVKKPYPVAWFFMAVAGWLSMAWNTWAI
jgi:hypothetical protein